MSGESDSDAVGRFLTTKVREGWMPGACWWIGGPAGPYSHGAVGRAASQPSPEALSESSPYDLASLTKPLATALLALLLEQDGLLALDSPASRYLDELARSPYAGASLIDLAAHRAGLPAWRPLYLAAGDRESYLRQIAATPPAVAPGETLYSDLGYILLGLALERVSGSLLDRLFGERIAGPLGLERIGFAGDRRAFSGAAPTEQGNAYERQMAGEAGAAHPWRTRLLRGEVHDANAHGLGGVGGHSGLFGTAKEVAMIAAEILQPERLALDAANREKLLRPVPGSDERTFGLMIAAGSSAARGALPAEAPGHTGFTGTSIWFEPGRDRFYVLLTNRVHPAVQRRGLDPVRREFHRIAAGLGDR